jgi:dienelactone hydrolase
MAYDPFIPGRFTVDRSDGVVTDAGRGGRRLPFQVWSPDQAEGRLPLIVFSHTSGGHRRQSSFLCEHLAGHGYVVAAADHTNNTAGDTVARAAAGPLSPAQIDELVRGFIADRVPDIRVVIDEVTRGPFAERIDGSRIGLLGYSFGGWAVLATPEHDDRIRAIVAMAPAGNSKPLPGIIPATLTFAWRSEVATLFLVAERDRFTPLPGQYELLERAPGEKRMFILKDADHGHFGDEVTDPGVSAEHAHTFARGLALAHFDSVLKGSGDATAMLADGVSQLARRGVAAESASPVSELG